MNGLQGGDPAKLAKALVQLASQDEPPQRWAAGADAVETWRKRPSVCSPRPTPTGTVLVARARRHERLTQHEPAGRAVSRPLPRDLACDRLERQNEYKGALL